MLGEQSQTLVYRAPIASLECAVSSGTRATFSLEIREVQLEASSPLALRNVTTVLAVTLRGSEEAPETIWSWTESYTQGILPVPVFSAGLYCDTQHQHVVVITWRFRFPDLELRVFEVAPEGPAGGGARRIRRGRSAMPKKWSTMSVASFRTGSADETESLRGFLGRMDKGGLKLCLLHADEAGHSYDLYFDADKRELRKVGIWPPGSCEAK